ncbi:MAG TPA: hypothetical protein DDW65_12810 [Firmicutes bacterium]|nr:hypothetical protein [Bacillota bacterium]
MKVVKFSLAWVRISILCVIVVIIVFFISRQPGVDKIVRRIMTSTLLSNEEWKLELDKTYTLCGHTETTKNVFTSLKSLEAALAAQNRNYRFKRISGHLHVYGMTINDYCSNCREHQFLGISEGNVAVIMGTPDKPGPIQEKTAINIKDLPQLELADLRKGIPFKNTNEKLQLIEGLNGLSAN